MALIAILEESEKVTPIMSSRRGSLEIIESILRLLGSRGAMKRTHITYVLMVNNEDVKLYLGLLKQKGMIEEIPDTKRRNKIKITDQGFKFLALMKQVRNMLE